MSYGGGYPGYSNVVSGPGIPQPGPAAAGANAARIAGIVDACFKPLQYVYQYQDRVRSDVIQLLTAYPSLNLQVATHGNDFLDREGERERRGGEGEKNNNNQFLINNPIFPLLIYLLSSSSFSSYFFSSIFSFK